ncbi:peptide ABC transporter substrate-binding protein [Microbacterium marinilacus]|uniref:ABC transporter substrate-binding protein n=1 Tax=Microbacterium marinilacus TaxID=415209 RepID=A0ABP7BQQ0_9MICO|nr:ABC transporter substrate-binding protein [Microbacterium marinilacus]MBY0690409.1 ABC transporter substrate-binding protein [Microbacterium marinilacus]
MRGLLKGVAAASAVLALTLTGCSAAGPDGGDDALDEITIGSSDPVPNLTPGRQSNAFGLTMSVFSPLTFLDGEGELSYVAAESVESDDQTTWTITLRDGWTFHDGSPVTAQDYVDSWNTVAYGPNAFENTGQLAAIEGYDEVSPAEGEPTAEELSGLEVVDDLTFTVTLEQADGQFPVQLSQAQTAFYPMPQSAFDDLDAYGKQPVGNGPFALTAAWTEGSPIVAERYEDYAGDEPTVDRITWVPYTDRLTAYTDALAGNVDIAWLPATRMKQVTDDFDEDHVYSFSAPGISYLGIPYWDDRFSDIRVRQAISMAIDRDAVNEAIFGDLNKPATAWTPSIMPGTPEGVCGEYCEYDPEAAAALLEEAGGFDGQLTIHFPGGAGHEDLYNAVANYLRQNLGVDAVARPSVGWAEFGEDRNNQVLDGPFFSRWGALYPSQQSTLRAMFSSTPGCINCGGELDPDIDAALQEADVTGDETGAAYAEVQELIAEEFPVIPMFEESYNYVTSDRIAELTPSGVGEPILTDVVLADD